MKKICIFLCLLLPLMMFMACNDQQPPENTDPAVTDKVGIMINAGTSLTIGVGETKQLSAINLKNDSVTSAVHWESDNAAVVSVDYNGLITGIADGTANITVTSADGKYKATCAVTVSSVLLGVNFETATLEMEKGSQATLKVILTPENVSNVTLNWVTGDPKIVTVADGVVTAVGNGTTSIIVSDAEGKHASVCTVTVVTTVTGIELDKNIVTINKGATHKLTATLIPEGVSDDTITWTSSNTDIVTVTDDGTITAVAGGAAIITVTSGNGKTATCNVIVTSPVEGVTLDHAEMILNVGQVQRLIASILPVDANNQEMVWESSNLSVVTVDGSGVINALKTGTAVITVTTVDGYFTASCNVTVKNAVTEITFETVSGDLEQGKTIQLIPILNPIDADQPILTWTTSDPAIAIVADDGTVTAVGVGEAVITVTAENGVSATYTLNVIELEILIDKIIVEPMLDNVKIAIPFTIEVAVIPLNTTEGYTIISADSSIVRVNADGTLTPLKAGQTLITVVSKSGGATAQCVVYVAKLTAEERDAYQSAFDQKHALLNQQYADNMALIDEKWDEQIASTKNKLALYSVTTKAEYDAQRAILVKSLNDAQAVLDNAINTGATQESIEKYTTIRDTYQELIDELDNNWTMYNLTSTKLNNLETSKANEQATENSRYQTALKELQEEYAFLNFIEPDQTEEPDQTTEDPEQE